MIESTTVKAVTSEGVRTAQALVEAGNKLLNMFCQHFQNISHKVNSGHHQVKAKSSCNLSELVVYSLSTRSFY